MPVNLDKPQNWKADIAKSVDMYNDWFMRFAPEAFRTTRIQTTKDVEATLASTKNLTNIKPDIIKTNPSVLPTLRMATCPPIAVDRLIGLAGVTKSMVMSIEKKKKLPPKMAAARLESELAKIGAIIEKMADPDVFVWLNPRREPTDTEIHRAAIIVADRLCGSVANPIIRNAQEQRQLENIRAWLTARGYTELPEKSGIKFDAMESGTFSFRMNVPVSLEGGVKELTQEEDDAVLLILDEDEAEHNRVTVNIPVDAVIMPLRAKRGELPLFIEAKSAGDFTNVNKRRKEEAVKMTQLRNTYGDAVRFNLFLCGYFDSGYLGYEAAEGIDWVWEHRIDDLEQFGI